MSVEYYAKLSDGEIRDLLEKRNIKYGPITDSTRAVYISKLVRYDNGSLSSVNSRSPRSKKAYISGTNESGRSLSSPVTSATHYKRIKHRYPQTVSDECDAMTDPELIDFSPLSNRKHGSSSSHCSTPLTENERSFHGHPKKYVSEEFHHHSLPLRNPDDRRTTQRHQIDNSSNNPSSSFGINENEYSRRQSLSHRSFPRITSSNERDFEDEVDMLNCSSVFYNIRRRNRPIVTPSRVLYILRIMEIVFSLTKYLFVILPLFFFICLYIINSNKKHVPKIELTKNLEECVIKIVTKGINYNDCHSVKNYNNTTKFGSNRVSVSRLYGECQKFLPLDYHYIEGFMLYLKDISYIHGLVCFDHLNTTVDCSDNIYYVSAVPTFLQRLTCGMIILTNFKNILTTAIGISLLVIIISYCRSKRRNSYGLREMTLEKSALFMLYRQHYLYIKGYAESPYLPIDLIRDSLIPINEREKSNESWNAASYRIHTNHPVECIEIQVSGVNTSCWALVSDFSNYKALETDAIIPIKRWYPSLREVNVSKLSQHQISSAPTCFLKIFHAHVANEEIIPGWIDLTKNAIIERCYCVGVKILFCKVDLHNDEGVVYLHAADVSSAALAYNTLNNMWLSGNQLVCKFVSQLQYYSRFPRRRDGYRLITYDYSLPSSLK